MQCVVSRLQGKLFRFAIYLFLQQVGYRYSSVLHSMSSVDISG